MPESESIPRTAAEGRNPKGAGRHTIRTAEIDAKLLEGYRKLGTQSAACGYAGVAPSTVRGWLQEDEELSREVGFAVAEYVSRHALAWEKNCTEQADHREALRTVARGEYAPTTRQEITGDHGGPARIIVEYVNPPAIPLPAVAMPAPAVVIVDVPPPTNAEVA